MSHKFNEFEIGDTRISFTDQDNILLETGCPSPETYQQEIFTRQDAYLLGCALIELSKA